MRLIIKTSVKSSLTKVKNGFIGELFLKLNPPFPRVRLLQFDGCETGHRVIIELNFLLFKQYWISDIIEHGEDELSWYFVDQGTKLPFFLKSWKHLHRVVALPEGQSQIIDNITYSTGTLLTDILMYPALYFQFLYRKPIYRRVFS
jgi:ligand-binding SRPBCC domain-containing protein